MIHYKFFFINQLFSLLVYFLQSILPAFFSLLPAYLFYFFPSHIAYSYFAFTHFTASSFSHTGPSCKTSSTHFPPPSLTGCLCSTGSKSLAAARSSPNLLSLCTIALGTKPGPHNSRPACVNSRANTVKAKTHFLLSPTSPAKKN